jgi:hypothetical protein
MKSINRRALAALVFGFLTLGTGSAFAAQTKAHGCCAEQTSCGMACCKETRQTAAFDQTAERFKAKYGREYPGKRSIAQTASQSCCNHC